MFINVKSRLEQIQKDLKNGEPINRLPVSGTLAVIEGQMDFRKPDGFTQFMILVINHAISVYGKQDPEWQSYLDRICQMGEKLRDANTRFTGKTAEDFKVYCKTLSDIVNKDVTPLDKPHLNVLTIDYLVPFMEKCVAEKYYKGFYYKLDENAEELVMEELVEELSGAKFDKPSQRNHDVSYHLLMSGYHEHVHDALNILFGTAVYAINCSSTRERDAYSFDKQKVHNDLRYVELILQRTETLI